MSATVLSNSILMAGDQDGWPADPRVSQATFMVRLIAFQRREFRTAAMATRREITSSFAERRDMGTSNVKATVPFKHNGVNAKRGVAVDVSARQSVASSRRVALCYITGSL